MNQFSASVGAGTRFDSRIVESLEGGYTDEEKMELPNKCSV